MTRRNAIKKVLSNSAYGTRIPAKLVKFRRDRREGFALNNTVGGGV